jgi:hypothetical protein
MEFLLLAVLGLATFGAKEMLSGEEEDSDSKDSKSNSKNGAKGSKKDAKDKDSEDSEEPQKTAKQELIEAIAKYEAETRSGEISKLLYEIKEK